MTEEILHKSKEIVFQAISDHSPAATVLMLSGGDDSLTAYHVAKELGIKIDFVIHGNTRTGIPLTTDFARMKAEAMGDTYLEADAGESYENYLFRKGFFGKGLGAHAFSYHILKQDHFERVVAANIRKRKRNFKILFLNGGRKDESENRKVRFANPIKITNRRPNDIWVNIINDWSKKDCLEYMEGNCIKRNPVSVNLCRSGECMCGTMQSKGDRLEASFFYPDWGKKLDELEAKVKAIHNFGWGENKPKQKTTPQTDLFQPMCVGCTKNEV
jgi:3'-phosphoadenosine 5'-phosphosulfate sulfotransferase (PAPS reductase)/FAD synthetase